ncbi:unnamed protein product, partial [marine sediment metagenome]
MRIKYLIPFIALILIFSFALACNGTSTESKKVEEVKEEKSLATETIPKTIDVKYIVIGLNSMDIEHTPPNEDKYMTTHPIRPEVSVTYSNSQGGTEQISAIKLEKDIYSLGLSEIPNPDKWNGEI